MGVLDKIDFTYGPSTNTSIDFRLLDAPCDHLVRNEQTTFTISSLTPSGTSPSPAGPINYNSIQYNSFNYGQQINPTASALIKTKLPYVNDGSLVLFENVINASTVVSEEFIVSSGNISNFFSLQFPPVTNTTSAKQKIFVDNTNYKLINFTRYTLAQLYGNIKFTNKNDIGQHIVFSYNPAKRIIPAINSDKTPNYEFVGLDQSGKGIIRVYGRALHSTMSSILLKYTTQSIDCTKCGGSNELNDIIFDQNGRMQLTYDFSKLIQDFFKRLLTQKGSDVFAPQEGSSLGLISGQGKRDPELIDTLIKNEIIGILKSVRAKQTMQQDIQRIS